MRITDPLYISDALQADESVSFTVKQTLKDAEGNNDWGGMDASERIGEYFLWGFNDYTRGLNSQTLGSGVVDIDRCEKNCFYWLKSMQPARNPVYGPMIYISSDNRSDSRNDIMVFSNCDRVKLYQNEKLAGEIDRTEALRLVPQIAKNPCSGSNIRKRHRILFCPYDKHKWNHSRGSHFRIAFSSPQTLLGNRIYWEKDSSWYTYSLEVSSDGGTWEKAIDNVTVGGQHYKAETYSRAYENINFARVTIHNITAGGDYQIGIAEWILYGFPTEKDSMKEYM